MIAGSQENYDNARASLERMQGFDAKKITREELGTAYNFKDAVAPAERLVELYNRLPLSSLDDFPDAVLNVVKNQADADFSRLNQILEFDETKSNAYASRTSLIDGLPNGYPGSFSALYPLISYGASKTADFQRLEKDGRAAVQAVEDRSKKLMDELQKSSEGAKEILDEARKVAAEQGVTQQAFYFKEQADVLKTDAVTWGKRTTAWAV
jgi:hypothetical protein